MQRLLERRGLKFARHIALSATLLTLASVAACGFLPVDADDEAAHALSERSIVEAYGKAEIQVMKNRIAVSVLAESEAGFVLRALPDAKEPIIVQFAYSGAAPLNLRLQRGNAYDYRSAATESRVLLGPGFASEALFYGAGPLHFDIKIEGISSCGKDNFVCLESGQVETTMSGRNLNNRILIRTYGSAQLTKVRRQKATVVRQAASGEYGILERFDPNASRFGIPLSVEV